MAPMVGIEFNNHRQRGRMEKGCIVVLRRGEQLVRYNETLEQVWELVNVACRGNVGTH